MKSILLFTGLLLLGVPANAQHSAVRQVELSKVSRGYEEHVRITADSLHVFIENKMGERPVTDFSRKVTPEEWTNLVEIIEARSVKEFQDLPSPTMKRAYDAAMHSTITIHIADGGSVSHGYDDENPHDAFLLLLKQIRALSGVKGKP